MDVFSCYDRILLSPKPHVSESIRILEENILSFGCECIALSFNGGKDCTVILHLLHATLCKLRKENNLNNMNSALTIQEAMKMIKCVYFQNPNEFAEINDFINQLETIYNFSIAHLKGSYKDALNTLISEYPIKVFVMGQRNIDPDAVNIKVLQESDPGWPKFLRLNPILNWTHDQVWEFLLEFDLPYCSLYDSGYTSLGNTLDTLRNPHLLQDDGNYLPAFKLENGLLERAGRNDSNYHAKKNRKI